MELPNKQESLERPAKYGVVYISGGVPKFEEMELPADFDENGKKSARKLLNFGDRGKVYFIETTNLDLAKQFEALKGKGKDGMQDWKEDSSITILSSYKPEAYDWEAKFTLDQNNVLEIRAGNAIYTFNLSEKAEDGDS